ncbi:MAG: hypothetical protein RL153_2346 [Verrucomicrobiota bacterium]|jgi:hypothetical protein
MAVTNVGKAVVWGITTTGMNKDGAAITNASAIIYASQSLSRSTDTMEHRNNLGEVDGFTTYNQSQQLEIECYPTGSTLANARTLRDALPVPGQRVTIVDSADANDPTATDFICTAASYRKTNSDKASYTMTLQRFAGIATYSPVT